ncbi:MAG: MYXO-CTERM sorting domain-containing protein [Polyangiaceae bacterium]
MRVLGAKALGLGFGLIGLLGSGVASAATYKVGPGEQYEDIDDTLLGQIAPGDVIEVMGDHTYHGTWWFDPDNGGTAGNPVTVRGVPVNGRLPIVEGVGSGEWDQFVVLFYANHFVFENFEIIGDGNEQNSCLVNKADDVTVRNVVVHGCGRHGLLGTDDESGSLTVEYSEFYGNGAGQYYHQIYAATDESTYPGSVFRLQYCYIHDGTGGNSVKSRAERNEIYFNWIEGGMFHELDLIGPDGADPSLAREDSDIVGNVLIKHSEWYIARIGGDGTGSTSGRYRFVNNTMVLGPESERVIQLQEEVQQVEMYNNVIYRGAGPAQMFRHNEQIGPDAVHIGSHNWIQPGWTDVPSTWTNTVEGADPGFMDLAGYDFRPSEGAPLVNAGTMSTADTGSFAFPNPLTDVGYVPPSRMSVPPGNALTRMSVGEPDIGAFEFGSGTDPGPGLAGGGGQAGSSQGGSGQGGSGQGGSGNGQGGSGASAGASAAAGGSSEDGGCGCRTAPGGGTYGGLVGLALAGLLLGRRRRSSGR